MDLIREVRLIAGLEGFGFTIGLGEFQLIVANQGLERQAWVEASADFDVLDWLVEELRSRGE